MAHYLLPTLKIVSLIFATASILTGARALVDPIGFSSGFGLPLTGPDTRSPTAQVYTSLMGVRQLSMGVIISVFAYLGKWEEVAIILAIIGVVTAGADGIYIARGGNRVGGLWHTAPGALISALAVATLAYLGVRQ